VEVRVHQTSAAARDSAHIGGKYLLAESHIVGNLFDSTLGAWE
jgi:hypothetical protein